MMKNEEKLKNMSIDKVVQLILSDKMNPGIIEKEYNVTPQELVRVYQEHLGIIPD